MSIPHDSGPGAVSWRDRDGHKHSPVYTGYEFEQSVCVGGRWMTQVEAYRIRAGVAECESLLFESGWRAADGGQPPMNPDVAWLHGFNAYGDAYPQRRWEDPYKGMNEDYARWQKLNEQDDVTRDIKRKSKARLIKEHK